MTMKICSYTMTGDTGFAPNPFYNYCTLAACTPNHMNAQLCPKDYIAGFFTDRSDPYLVYWMEVAVVLDYNSYFNDPRFHKRKPKMAGSWIARCGDNIYFLDESGNWTQAPTFYHQDEESIRKDIRYAKVYIGWKFGYFGKLAYSESNRLPQHLRTALKKGIGIKYTRESDLHFNDYLTWLDSKSLGRHGEPRDRGKHSSCYSGTKDCELSFSCRTRRCA